jgi:hypothetical protein
MILKVPLAGIHAIIVLLCITSTPFCQKNLKVHPGLHIRLIAPPEINQLTIAEVALVDSAILTVITRDLKVPFKVDFSSITRLEIRQKSSKVIYGMVTGFVVFGLTSTVIGVRQFDDDCPDCPPKDWPEELPYDCSDAFCAGFSRSQKIVAISLISSAIGATIGYFLGKAIKIEEWKSVTPDQLMLGVEFQQTKPFAISLSLNF